MKRNLLIMTLLLALVGCSSAESGENIATPSKHSFMDQETACLITTNVEKGYIAVAAIRDVKYSIAIDFSKITDKEFRFEDGIIVHRLVYPDNNLVTYCLEIPNSTRIRLATVYFGLIQK